MRILCKTQKTPEWFDARVGKVTASCIAAASKKLQRASGEKKKGDWHGDHDNYVVEIAWELVTRIPAEHYVSKAMDIGNQYEREARTEYMLATEHDVDETGFILHPTLDYFGCSPDGLVYDGKEWGGLEIKVPLLKTHQGYILAGEVPPEYQPQMQAGMLCCGMPWWDFCSYAPPDIYPDFPPQFRLFRKRLFAAPETWPDMEEAATATMEEAIALAKKIGAYDPKSNVVSIPATQTTAATSWPTF